jgi:hypothetical protein
VSDTENGGPPPVPPAAAPPEDSSSSDKENEVARKSNTNKTSESTDTSTDSGTDVETRSVVGSLIEGDGPFVDEVTVPAPDAEPDTAFVKKPELTKFEDAYAGRTALNAANDPYAADADESGPFNGGDFVGVEPERRHYNDDIFKPLGDNLPPEAVETEDNVLKED